jgi:tetratricopeptide (TPR) repeat protein
MGQTMNQGGPGRRLNPETIYTAPAAAAAAAAAAAFLVFLSALSNSFVGWDETFLLSQNPGLRSLDLAFMKWAFTTVVIGSWYPLVHISFALDNALWGGDPWGFHLTNVILHSANTFLVLILVTRLVELGRGRKEGGEFDRFPLAAGVVTALLFALHPLRVESVVWVAERKDVLYSLFYLSSVLAYLGYARQNSTRRVYYTASLVFFAMSLMSKPMAVTLPVVLLIIDFCPLGRLRLGGGRGGPKKIKDAKRVLVEKVPFFILSLSVSFITITHHSFKLFTTSGPDMLERVPRYLAAVGGYLFYLKKMVLPLWLAPEYPPPVKGPLFPLEYSAYALLLIAITVYAVRSLKKNMVFSAAWFYYLVTLLPVIMRSNPADRYTYLASLGPFLLVGLFTARAFEGGAKKYLHPLTAAAVVVVSLTLSALTVRQTAVWKDAISLWSHEIRLFPGISFRAYNNRGSAYSIKGELEPAIDDFTKAIEINPPKASKLSNAYNGRGSAYKRLGETDKAISDFTRAIEVAPLNTKAYFNRGNVKRGLGEYEEAISDFTRVVEIKPGFAWSYLYRGMAYEALGELERAIGDFTSVIDIDPRNAIVLFNRGRVYESLGEYEKAIGDFTREQGGRI